MDNVEGGTQELHSESYTHGVKEEMYWIPVNEIRKYRAYPSFLKDNLEKLNEGIVHIITDERKKYISGFNL